MNKQTKTKMREFLSSYDIEMVSLGAVILQAGYSRRSWRRVLTKYSHNKMWTFNIHNKQIQIKEVIYDQTWAFGTTATWTTTGSYNVTIGGNTLFTSANSTLTTTNIPAINTTWPTTTTWTGRVPISLTTTGNTS